MKLNICISAGRTQEWFDSLHRREQEDYLELHPHSKFKKDVPEDPDVKKNTAPRYK